MLALPPHKKLKNILLEHKLEYCWLEFIRCSCCMEMNTHKIEDRHLFPALWYRMNV